MVAMAKSGLLVPPLIVTQTMTAMHMVVPGHQRHAGIMAPMVLVVPAAGRTRVTGVPLRGCHLCGDAVPPLAPSPCDAAEYGGNNKREEDEDGAGDNETDDGAAQFGLVADWYSWEEHLLVGTGTGFLVGFGGWGFFI
jgi:hypothetical protein